MASPSAIGSMPEASGSSVPACPAFSAWNSHLIFDTASVEPMPTGLSSTTQPETGRPFFLRWRLSGRADLQGRQPAAAQIHPVAEPAGPPAPGLR